MPNYVKVKATAVDLVDDFSPKAVVAGYGTTFKAATKLATIGLSDPVRSVMPTRVNKVMEKMVGHGWQDVGPLDTVGCTTIGAFIQLLCKKSGTVVPTGEPT